jgi:hypothetical protein
MTIKFICEIKATENDIEDLKGTEITKRIESESPEKLLKALAFMNGTANGVPTLEHLLIHLFEKHAAYAGRNYDIFIKYAE